MAQLTIEVEPHSSLARTVSITLQGAIDAGTVVKLQNELDSQRDAGHLHILLEMTAVTYVNSTGVGALLRMHDALQAAGGHLVLVGVSSRVMVVFDAFGLEAILAALPDKAAAEAYLRSQGAGAAGVAGAAVAAPREHAEATPETFVSPPPPASRVETDEHPPQQRSPSQAAASSRRQRSAPAETPSVRRLTTVRYVPRMTTGRNFALVVMLSEQEVPPTDNARVQQVQSARDGFAVSVESPLVTVIPRVPGCLCVPERLELDVSRDRTTTTFWLTPLVEGDLRHASVDVWKSGFLVDALPVPAKVARPSTS